MVMNAHPRPAAADTPAADTPWHALPSDDVLHQWQSSARGLGSAQAQARRERYGPNRLAEAPPTPLWRRVLRQFNNLLILVLLAAAVTTALLGHGIDAGVILAVVLLNVTIGLIQEGKAERALAAIRALLTPHAQVWRDGRLVEVDATELVPGDVVQLSAGDRLPADVRWLRTHDVQVDESMLTGESVPVGKDPAPVDAHAALGDRRSMGYAGTLVTRGQGTAVVVATGMATEMGRIGRLLQSVGDTATPLVRQMAQMGRWITLAVLAAAALLFGVGWGLRGLPALDTFMAAVGLAVAAIPEGLPAILSVTLAIGVQRMARQRAIVRQLPAVETLGCVTVICSDKTGTLTRNEMTAQTVVLSDGIVTVEGSGYAPQGALLRDGHPLQAAELWREAPALLLLAEGVALCNDAALVQDESGQWQLSGDPTEGALLTLAMKAGLDPNTLRDERPRVALLPFESERRYMATAHADGDALRVWVKGAPEAILARCSHVLDDRGKTVALDAAPWQAQADAQAAQGRRVLAVATVRVPAGNALTHDTVRDGLTLVGLVGIIDPPREEAIEAVAQCRAARHPGQNDHGRPPGHRAGDRRPTRLGRAPAGHGGADDRHPGRRGTAARRARGRCLCARGARAQAATRARALQANGEVVAMTGDGRQRRPCAQKPPTWAVAMGHKGHGMPPRQAAAVVLTDDNFATIGARAVRAKAAPSTTTCARVITFFAAHQRRVNRCRCWWRCYLGLALPIAPVANPLGSTWSAPSRLAHGAGVRAHRTRHHAPPPPRPPGETDPDPLRAVAASVWSSTLFAAGIFGTYQWAFGAPAPPRHGADAGRQHAWWRWEIFYLFSVRYLKAPSLHLGGRGRAPRACWPRGWAPRCAAAGGLYLPTHHANVVWQCARCPLPVDRHQRPPSASPSLGVLRARKSAAAREALDLAGLSPVQPLALHHAPLTHHAQKSLQLRTFGCQMNEYDSDKMADVLAAADGYEPTDDPEQADLILFNTCSVREKAQEKVFSDLGRVKHLKKKGVLIGVGGCVASQEGEAIIQRAPYVDVVFGPQTLHRLPELLRERERQSRPQVDVSFPEIEKFDHLPPARVEGASAFVSIMEGCSKYCSYCVVPYTRGEEVSRPLEDVLVEVAGLAEQGVKEVTLLGQNVNAWRGGDGEDFALLLECVAEIPGIERIRYTTSHPNEFTPRLIEAYARIPKLVSHLHLPVQHGSDRILMAMKRGYTVMEYKSTVRKLRAVRPDLSLSSDFIVGFPGETEDDFRQAHEAGGRRRLRCELQLHLQPTPRHTRSQPARRYAARGEAAPPANAAKGAGGQRRAHQRQPCGHRTAHPGRRPVEEKPARADGPHRLQPHRQLRRRPARPAPHWADDRRHHHAGPAALAAGGGGGQVVGCRIGRVRADRRS
jgi:tRNA-N(6)-(isopentenyl)adenosine-37 thiotransferase enzyme MiaB